jgi:hypothetical protein
MLYHLPLKEHINSKWLTVTLVAIYLLITAFLFLNSSDKNVMTTGDTDFHDVYSQNQQDNNTSVN